MGDEQKRHTSPHPVTQLEDRDDGLCTGIEPVHKDADDPAFSEWQIFSILFPSAYYPAC
jgi:hypothetical protein